MDSEPSRFALLTGSRASCGGHGGRPSAGEVCGARLRATEFLFPIIRLAVVVFWVFAGFPAIEPTVLGDSPSPGYRLQPLPVPPARTVGLRLLPPHATGISFSNHLSDAAIARNRLLEIGSGVALGDIDGDGWTDIYFCGLERGNVLYRNRGQWRFEDVTARTGLACDGQFSTGAVLVDLDGDHDLDLLVNSLGGGTRCFRNEGNLRFREDDHKGLLKRMGATSMALADIEGDGDLDLYVTNYRTDTFFDHPQGLRMEMRVMPDGTRAVEPRERFLTLPAGDGTPFVIERGESDVLYLNQGGGRFTPVPWNLGAFVDPGGHSLKEAPSEWGLAVMFRDLNGDGAPDLYVCNDFIAWPDRMWINEGGRRFRAAPPETLRHFSLSSMAVDVADINRDGYDDLFVVDMLSPHRSHRAYQRPDLLQGKVRWPREDPFFQPEVPHNTLHLARRDGTYAEIACLAGVAAADWAPSALFMDVDLDGWEDILIGAGNKHDVQDADALTAIGKDLSATTAEMRLRNLKRLPDRRVASTAFRNRRDLTFEDASREWGFDAKGVVHGFALGDLDNDGDLDVVMNALEESARVYRNEAGAGRLAIRLHGLGENTQGVGARLRVEGGPVSQTQEMIAGGRYCSSDQALKVFATGESQRLSVEVLWRSGERSLIQNVPPNQLLDVFEPAEPTPPLNAQVELGLQTNAPAAGWPIFEDASARLGHAHSDASFDDFSRQPLLPRRLSEAGPGTAWADLDQDGDDDLVIGAGQGGVTGVFRNRGQGQFEPWEPPVQGARASTDQTSVLVWQEEGVAARLVVGESNWESADSPQEPFRTLDLRLTATATPLTPRSSDRPTATGPLAMADVDGDGDLDLFVGTRVMAGRYPETAPSRVYHNAEGVWKEAQVLDHAGLVSGAQFSDWDGDGDPDLVLACEWGPPRALRNESGRFVDVSEAVGLLPYLGWWSGVVTADLDADGRMDLVLSNWGRNGRFDITPHSATPVYLYYGSFSGAGRIETLLASMDPDLGLVTPWRDRRSVGDAIPSVLARFPSHRAYGKASVAEILGEAASQAQRLEATTFDSMVFLNRGNRFVARPLPIEAQFSSAQGIGVADFDGDGHLDVFLAQNFFGVDAEMVRQDAGVGLVMLGDGTGGFRSLSPTEAGCFIPGEGRGVAVGDFDQDGRADLAVGVLRGPTRLLRNRASPSGVRIRLKGPPRNPHAVGAQVRIRVSGQWGPTREVTLGGGHYSQNASTLVAACASEPQSIWVRWPGTAGGTNEFPWPQGARSVEVSPRAVVSR